MIFCWFVRGLKTWQGLLLVSGMLIWLGAHAQVSAGDFLITEFMAANSSGEKDEDGAFSDWIELYNSDPADRSLAGWSLSDDPKNPAKWRFPAVTVPKGGFLLVFASGKDRTAPVGKLHTNFKLNRDGGYLALSKPDGQIASEFLSYPRQLSDVSYGVSMTKVVLALLPDNAPGRMLIPSDDTLGLGWIQTAFDDSAWATAINGVGYDRIPAGEVDPSEPPALVQDQTGPGDIIVATSLNSPSNEGVQNAIDNNTATKYLNFDKLNAGFTVTLAKGPAVLTGLSFTSANDAPERDPASFTLTGSNDGQLFIEIARGAIPSFSGRFTKVQVTFANTAAYTRYRLLFPTVRNASAAVAMQISEVEFLGKAGPEPHAISEFVRTNVETPMFGQGKSSMLLRLPFVVPDGASWDELSFAVRYDDGFSAWLNGRLIARGNAPANLAFNALAPTNRYSREATQPAIFNLASVSNPIAAGANLLAIQGWNDRVDSPQFLLEAQIQSSRTIPGPPGYLDVPTPRAPNSDAKLGLVADPVPSLVHGFYDTPFDLAITCSTDGATIRYTTNGSPPTATNGFIYAGPLRVDRTTVLRVGAFKANWRSSRILTHTYIFVGDVARQSRTNLIAAGFPASWGSQSADYGLDTRVVGPGDTFAGKYARTITNDLKSLPTMSIAMNMEDMFGTTGIYSNPQAHGAAWERPGSIELIYPDPSPGFQEDAGFRIQGGAFRGFNLTLKKSFRVIFRSSYGKPTLRYPLFGPDSASEVNNFVLRANSNDAWPYGGANALYVRDAFAMESMRAMGRVSSHSRFVHLYINGAYWGLYNPSERPDAAFCASYYGGDKSTWDAINQDSVPDGTYDAWNRMLAMLSQDFTRTDVYQKIQGNNPDGTRNPAYENLIDVDDLIDYMILNFYIGNADWPGRNWWAGRDRNNGDGFKFHPWDSETALGFTAVDANMTGVNSAVARPYAALRANADFRQRFGDHVYRHFFNGGVFYVATNGAWNPNFPENNRPAARFFALSEQINRAIVGETARWGDQLRSSPYSRDEHWLITRNGLLANYFPRRSSNVIAQLRAASLYPRTDPPVMNQRGGMVEPGFQLALSAAQGVIYYTTNNVDPKDTTRSTRYTGPIQLLDHVEIKTRALNGTEWSALNQASFTVGIPRLIVSELHYHPAGPDLLEQAAGFTNADDFEFLELFNAGTGASDLKGLRFEKGIQFDFASNQISRLAPGEFLLMVKNREAFELRYGHNLPIAGEYSGKLDNNGERVQALFGNGQVALDFAYGTQPPWPVSADGDGPSLELANATDDPNAPASWRASAEFGGSPGRPTSPQPLRLEIVQITPNLLHIAFQGRKKLGYTLYSNDTLSATNWTPIEKGLPLPSDSRVEINITPSLTRGAKFYKVSVP